jgi:hypothetical protein
MQGDAQKSGDDNGLHTDCRAEGCTGKIEDQGKSEQDRTDHG